MARSIDFKDAVITLKDNTSPTKKTLTVNVGDGNFTYNTKRALIVDKERGKLSGATVRLGDEEVTEISLSCRWEAITASTGDPPTIEDALNQSGEADDWVSTVADTCQPFAVDLFFTVTPSCTAEDIETLEFPDFRHTDIKHDPKTGMLDITGFAMCTRPTATRTAQT